MLNVGSLFSGIGGFDLGLERAGMRVVWQCEADEFCQRVLRKHWPDVPCFEDVSLLRPGRDLRGLPRCDVLCAGWPCPGFSVAGRGEGFNHEGSGLWSEVIRLVCELRPRYVVLENVAALLGRGVGRVFGDLAACGYDAEWDCIPASAVGAPHRRDRLWVVAYPQQAGLEGLRAVAGEPEVSEPRDGGALAETCVYCGSPTDDGTDEHEECLERSLCEAVDDVGDTEGPGGDERPGLRQEGSGGVRRGRSDDAGWWESEPDVGRVAHGVPARVDRLAALGNALVPQIAEWLGRRIIEAEEEVRQAA